ERRGASRDTTWRDDLCVVPNFSRVAAFPISVNQSPSVVGKNSTLPRQSQTAATVRAAARPVLKKIIFVVMDCHAFGDAAVG
ncbi:MAG: hypothetical protein ACKOHM_06095, partial [Spartobacteria bacterium]